MVLWSFECWEHLTFYVANYRYASSNAMLASNHDPFFSQPDGHARDAPKDYPAGKSEELFTWVLSSHV